MSNHLNKCRDGIFGNLQIKGKKIVDEKRNLSVRSVTSGNGEFRKDLKVKGDLTVDGCIKSNKFGCCPTDPFKLFKNKEQDRVSDPTRGRSVVYGKNMVSCMNPYAAQIAHKVLEDGGNAVDAAVAMGAALDLVEPHFNTPGGDAFMIIWLEDTKELKCVRGQGRSPAALTRQKIVDEGLNGMPLYGSAPIMVPGQIGCWDLALNNYGTKTLGELLDPTIQLATEGFLVSEMCQADWKNAFNPDEPLSLLNGVTTGRFAGNPDPNLIDLYANPIPEPGDLFTNPGLADTFTRIKNEGIGVLYGGSLGQEIVDYIQANYAPRDYLKLSDLAAYSAEIVDLISTEFAGVKVHEMPAPSQGIVALETLKILEGLNIGNKEYGSVDYWHAILEALKISFSDYAKFVGDPAYMSIDESDLLGPTNIANRVSQYDPTRAQTYTGELNGMGTVQSCVADANGNMVSYISSGFFIFSSGVVPKKPGNPYSVGFPMNDRGFGFNFTVGSPNVVGPSKLPQMSNIPAFITKNTGSGEEAVMAIGCMGASMQPQAHVQIILNRFLYNMNIQQAIDSSRIFANGPSNLQYSIEPYVSECVKTGLAGRGHEFIDASVPFGKWTFLFGKSQCIEKIPDGYAGGTDRRSDGISIPGNGVPTPP